MDSFLFNFEPPAHDVSKVSPTGESRPPARGKFRASRHASLSGAAAAMKTWTVRQSAYLQVVRNAGALSDHEAAAILKCQLSSVNSVRGALNTQAEAAGHQPMLIPDGFDTHEFSNAIGEKTSTRRTRWTVNPDYRGPR